MGLMNTSPTRPGQALSGLLEPGLRQEDDDVAVHGSPDAPIAVHEVELEAGPWSAGVGHAGSGSPIVIS